MVLVPQYSMTSLIMPCTILSSKRVTMVAVKIQLTNGASVVVTNVPLYHCALLQAMKKKASGSRMTAEKSTHSGTNWPCVCDYRVIVYG